MIGNVSKNPKS